MLLIEETFMQLLIFKKILKESRITLRDNSLAGVEKFVLKLIQNTILNIL